MEVEDNNEQSSFENLSKFDVFLNHRGPDLKKTFVSHLEKELSRAGCDPFLDAKSLVKGKHTFNSINEALSGVLVHVAIFSPRYAESKWCLNELCDMLASHKPFIPVFYNVEPENLRWIENGPFAKAFLEHMKKGREQDVVRWKVALLEVATIDGFRLVDSNSDAKLVEKIVAVMLNALPTPPPLPPARHSVGLKESSQHVIDMLYNMGNNVGVVGICGMGGIGKTTLVREIFNEEQSCFQNRCFLKNVKDAKGINAMMDLQRKMVTGLLHLDAMPNMHWDFARWFEKIRKQKVFLVIDDIKERKQFDELIPHLQALAAGSRVLITSRDQDVLKSIMRDAPQSVLYQVPELGFVKARDLFVWCAFRKNSIYAVNAVFHNFVEEITRACCGLPLALEVMGGYLADKQNLPSDQKYWHDAAAALKENGEIITSLQISYDGLVNNKDKCMFLDIVCFMLGLHKNLAIEIWESSGQCYSASWSLSRLIDKCLVKIDGHGQLGMHDLVRDMGRNVVMQRAQGKPKMQSHIWDPSIAAKILQKNQEMNEVLALTLVRVDPSMAFTAEQFAKMKELRYLLLDGCHFNGDVSGWSEELRWLQWRNFPHDELPWDLKLLNLAVLELANSKTLIRIWARDFELEFPCKELRMLILDGCGKLEELPQYIHKLEKLKFLNLDACSSLKSLSDSLGNLTELEYLNLSGCSSLTSLPNLDLLGNLQKLYLGRCQGLAKLPDSFSGLSNLEELDLSWIDLFQRLPSSICGLKKLKILRMSACLRK